MSSQPEFSTSVLWNFGDNTALSTRKQQQQSRFACCVPQSSGNRVLQADCLQRGHGIKQCVLLTLHQEQSHDVQHPGESHAAVRARRSVLVSSVCRGHGVPFQHRGSRFTVTSSLRALCLLSPPCHSTLVFPRCWWLLRNL